MEGAGSDSRWVYPPFPHPHPSSRIHESQELRISCRLCQGKESGTDLFTAQRRVPSESCKDHVFSRTDRILLWWAGRPVSGMRSQAGDLSKTKQGRSLEAHPCSMIIRFHTFFSRPKGGLVCHAIKTQKPFQRSGFCIIITLKVSVGDWSPARGKKLSL